MDWKAFFCLKYPLIMAQATTMCYLLKCHLRHGGVDSHNIATCLDTEGDKFGVQSMQ